jgi:hypothetical protein
MCRDGARKVESLLYINDMQRENNNERGSGEHAKRKHVFFSAHEPDRSAHRTVKAAARESLSPASSTGLPIVTRVGRTTVIALATAKTSLDRLGHAVHR